jgi:TP901 family phage tail tape measure protein
MATVGSLVVKLTAHTKQFRDNLRRAGGPLTTLRRQVGMVTSAMMGFSGVLSGVGLVYGLKRLADASEAFNQSMHSSLAIMDPVSNKMRRTMVETAKKVAWQTKFSAKEAADAYYYLASAGLDVSRQIAVMPRTAKFAQAGMMDLARASDVSTDVLSALGLATKDATTYLENFKRVTNVIVGAAAKANATVEQFGDALMNKGALAAKLAGKEIEEATAVLMVMADKGFAKGAKGGQALWMAFRDLKRKAVENADAFKKMGIHVDAGGGKMANIADIMEDLTRKMSKLQPLMQQKMLLKLGFPAKSLAPIMTLLGTTDKLREFQEYLNGIDDVVARVANKQLPPFTAGWNKVKAAFEGLAIDNMTGSMAALGRTLEGVAKTLTVLPLKIDEMYLAWLTMGKGMIELNAKLTSWLWFDVEVKEFERDMAAMEHAISRVEKRIVDARAAQHPISLPTPPTIPGIDEPPKVGKGLDDAAERMAKLAEQAEKARSAVKRFQQQMAPYEMRTLQERADPMFEPAAEQHLKRLIDTVEQAELKVTQFKDQLARAGPKEGWGDAAEMFDELGKAAERAEKQIERMKAALATHGMTGPQRQAWEMRDTAFGEEAQRLADQLDAKQRQAGRVSRLKAIISGGGGGRVGGDGAATPTFASGAGAGSREAYSAIIRASWKAAAKTQKTDEQILAELREQTAAEKTTAARIKRLLDKLEPVETHTIRPH